MLVVEILPHIFDAYLMLLPEGGQGRVLNNLQHGLIDDLQPIPQHGCSGVIVAGGDKQVIAEIIFVAPIWRLWKGRDRNKRMIAVKDQVWQRQGPSRRSPCRRNQRK